MQEFDPQELLAPLPPPPGWNPWEELANAVVRQAAEDWREAVHTLLHPPGRPGAVRNRQIREAADMLRDCESFFRSRWIRILTGEDGTKILEQLRREMIAHMDAREYLGLAVRLDVEIDGKLAELSRLHELVLGAPPGPEGGRTVQKLMELAEKVSREIDELVELKDEIRSAIDAVPDPGEREALRCRYMLGMSHGEIAGRLHIGIATVKRLLSRGRRFFCFFRFDSINTYPHGRTNSNITTLIYSVAGRINITGIEYESSTVTTVVLCAKPPVSVRVVQVQIFCSFGFSLIRCTKIMFCFAHRKNEQIVFRIILVHTSSFRISWIFDNRLNDLCFFLIAECIIIEVIVQPAP